MKEITLVWNVFATEVVLFSGFSLYPVLCLYQGMTKLKVPGRRVIMTSLKKGKKVTYDNFLNNYLL